MRCASRQPHSSWTLSTSRHGWPTIDLARDEVAQVIAEGFARAVLEADLLLGWIGGLPEYNGRVWELHPLVVRPRYRRRGIGRALTAAFESEARARGGLTATLGTDDDSAMTSLSDIDLYRRCGGTHRRTSRSGPPASVSLLRQARLRRDGRDARRERTRQARHLHVEIVEALFLEQRLQPELNHSRPRELAGHRSERGAGRSRVRRRELRMVQWR